MGGLVTGLQERISKKGSPWGIMTVEDFSGSAELKLFGESYLEYKKFGTPGTPVLISAQVQPGRFNPEKLDLRIKGMSLLSELKTPMVRDITINLNHDYSDSATFREIRSLMTEGENNQADLYFEITDPDSSTKVTLRCKKKVAVGRKLVNMLKDNDIPFRINARADNGF